MSESVLPKYMSHKSYNQTPTIRRDIYTSDERMTLVDDALEQKPPIEAPVERQLTDEEEALIRNFAEELEKVNQRGDDLRESRLHAIANQESR